MLLKPVFTVAFLFTCTAIFAQEKAKSSYDSALAKKLGADPYGMKQYVMVILTTGKTDVKEKATRDSLFAGHMNNIKKLASEGKMVVAGPLGKNDLNYRGIFVFNPSSIDDTKAMVASDPAVKAGIFDAIYIPWYCSAALMEISNIHEKVQKVSF